MTLQMKTIMTTSYLPTSESQKLGHDLYWTKKTWS